MSGWDGHTVTSAVTDDTRWRSPPGRPRPVAPTGGHSAIRFVTPDESHFGREAALLAQRHCVYQHARVHHPERWSRSTRNWMPAGPVRLNPAPHPFPALHEMKPTG